MQTFLIILFLAVLLVAALLLLSYFRNLEKKAQFRKIAQAQANRAPLSDLEFCTKLVLNSNDLSFVSAIRKALANRGDYSYERIYPDDELWETFDFQLGDFLDEFARDFIQCGHGDLPYEKLHSVGDFVKYLVSRRKES